MMKANFCIALAVALLLIATVAKAQGPDEPYRHLREQHRQNFVGCYAAMRRSSMSVNMSWRTAS